MKILSFGEVMMRLTPPEYKKLQQSTQLDLSFTGTGVNVLSGLSQFGYETSILTRLPDNNVGRAASAFIRQLGVGDTNILYGDNHIGSYFLEMGYGNRPSEVTYLERLNSAFGLGEAEDYDIDQLVDAYDVIHICGISLSLADGPRLTALALAKAAHEKGKPVYFDFNFRPSLNEEKSLAWMKEQYEEILSYSTAVFGGIMDLTRLLNLTGDTFEELSANFMKKYEISYFAGTKRLQENGEKSLAGFIFTKEGYFESEAFPLAIYDRIGTGDAYAAGIMLGVIEDWEPERTVRFATGSAVLAHTTFGDSPLLGREMIEKFVADELGDVIR